MKYGWEELNEGGYNITPTHIQGTLNNTSRNVRITRAGKRTIYQDTVGQQWVKIRNLWWRFPEQVEY